MSYPITLNLCGKLIVVIGGGKVAARKVRGLLEGGADRVRVVSPAIDLSIPDQVEKIPERYIRSHIEGAVMVFAATDSPAVNAQVAIDARAVGAWVNRADDHDESASDFSTPAAFRDGDVLLTASAGGNPAIATRIRDSAAALIDPRLVRMAGLMRQLRPVIRSAIHMSADARRDLLVWLATDEALSVLDSGGATAIESEVNRRITATRRA